MLDIPLNIMAIIVIQNIEIKGMLILYQYLIYCSIVKSTIQ